MIERKNIHIKIDSNFIDIDKNWYLVDIYTTEDKTAALPVHCTFQLDFPKKTPFLVRRYLCSWLLEESSRKFSQQVKELPEKLPDDDNTYCRLHTLAKNVFEPINQAFCRITQDLKYCASLDQSKPLMHAQEQLILEERKPQKNKLEILKAALEYRRVFYEMRIANRVEYYGIGFFQFKNRSSATAKLAATKEMLQAVDRLIRGDSLSTEEQNFGSATKNGELNKLFKKFQALTTNVDKSALRQG